MANWVTKTKQRKKIWDTVLLFVMTKLERHLCIAAVTPWCFMFGAHALGHWLHGFPPVQTQEAVQHIRRNNASPRSLPESRATGTILLLVSSFVYFYTLSSIFQVILTFFDNPSWFLVNISAIMAAWFPTVSPFLLMSRDSTLYSLYFAWIRNAKSPAIIRSMQIVYLSTMHSFQLFIHLLIHL